MKPEYSNLHMLYQTADPVGSDVVLFLDVDGVLNTRCGSLDHDKLDRLRHLLEKWPCQVVLSSTWRKTSQKLAQLLSMPWLFTRIRSVTPVLEEQTAGGLIAALGREAEIKAWLEDHPHVGHFVILDDEFMPELSGFQIKCDPTRGLDEVVNSALHKRLAELQGHRGQNPLARYNPPAGLYWIGSTRTVKDSDL